MFALITTVGMVVVVVVVVVAVVVVVVVVVVFAVVFVVLAQTHRRDLVRVHKTGSNRSTVK